MKFHYLIDYENVRDEGLDGIFDLTAEDTVSIFYTANAERINFSFVQRLLSGECKAAIKFIKGETGEQALDKQICFYLGWLVRSGENDCAYIIISKDKGYGNIIDLARKTENKEIRVFPKIRTCTVYFRNGEKMAKADEESAVKAAAEPVKEEAEEPKAEAPAEEVKPEPAKEVKDLVKPAQPAEKAEPVKEEPEKPEVKAESAKPEKAKPEPAKAEEPKKADPKADFFEGIKAAMKKKGGYDSETVEKVASVASEYFLKQNRKTRILNRLRNDYGKDEGKVIYDAIKSAIPKQPDEQPAKKNEKKAEQKAEEAAEVKEEKKPEEAKQKPSKKADAPKKGKKETDLNNAVTQAVNKVKIDDKALEDDEKKSAVAIINSHRKDEPNKILTNVRNSLVKEFKQVKGNTIYKAVKEHIEAYKKEQ